MSHFHSVLYSPSYTESAISYRINRCSTFSGDSPLPSKDEFGTARETVYESHPEVCFKAYHGADLPSKNSDAGVEARNDGLIKNGGTSFQPVVDLVDER